MDTDDLRIFCRVAQLGSFAAAARAEASEASTISRQVASLEARLGTRLFQRTTRKLALTEAGEIFLSRITPVLDDLAAAQAATVAAIEQPAGLLRITASHAFGDAVLAPLLTEFCRQFPAIDIDLLLTDSVLDLVAQQVDVALRSGPRPSGDLVIAKLISTERRLVASSEYLARSGMVEEPGDLLKHTCLSTSNAPQQQIWFFRDEGSNLEVPIRPKIRTSSTLTLHRCVRDGLGVSLLVDWLVDEDIRNGRLVRLLPRWKIAAGAYESAVWIVYPSRAYLPLKTRTFIDYVRARLTQRAF
jgi:DNA-binding transcriptional LysR family regulator